MRKSVTFSYIQFNISLLHSVPQRNMNYPVAACEYGGVSLIRIFNAHHSVLPHRRCSWLVWPFVVLSECIFTIVHCIVIGENIWLKVMGRLFCSNRTGRFLLKISDQTFHFDIVLIARANTMWLKEQNLPKTFYHFHSTCCRILHCTCPEINVQSGNQN